MRGRTEAVVTFVMHRGECLAFFRAELEAGAVTWAVPRPEPRRGGLRLPGYAHEGQHAEFDAEILRRARRAHETEYAPLMAELAAIGYAVTPLQRGRLKLPRYALPADDALAKLDRGGIWSLGWRLRSSGAPEPVLQGVLKRWETLTGEKYHDEKNG